MRMIRLAPTLLFSVLVLAGTAGTAGAWGDEGHRVVARLAEARLTPAAHSGVANLLDPGETLADASLWADKVKYASRPETRPWHFVDIPRQMTSYDATRDCSDPTPGACIVVQTEQARQTLANPGAMNRADALRFVVHFLGDLHQPLHCATDVGPDPVKHTDDGGNLKPACFFGSCTEHGKKRNVHFTWDSYVIEREHPDEDEYVAKLQTDLGQLSPAKLAAMQQGALVDWAEASHQLAVAHAYGDLPDPDSAGVYQLADDYEAATLPIIDKQLELAGVRLASVLNWAFDAGTAPPPTADAMALAQPPGKTGPAIAYPDTALTPGAINADITQDTLAETICDPTHTWSTKSIRPPASYTNGLKLQQMLAYGDTVSDPTAACVPRSNNPKCYEEDHLISLELGGAPKDPRNLWPEPYQPAPGAHQKDTVENFLRKQVCAGAMTLKDAQRKIATDWYAVYQSIQP